MRRSAIAFLAVLAMVFIALAPGTAAAQDKLKLAIGQKGNWDTAVPELGTRAGLFKKHGLELELLYTKGGGETQQAVIARSADIGLAAGTLGVMGAYSKGAPVRIIGAQATGAADFWYVRADSPIKAPADLAGKTMAYSTNGSSTHSMVLGFIETYKIAAKPTATGDPAGTFTSVMSRQIDAGWSSPPFGFDAIADNKIRIIWRGNELEQVRNQTVRTIIANAEELKARAGVFARFIAAYRETVDYMYASDQALTDYADFAKTSLANARLVRTDFFAKAMIDPLEFKGTAELVENAVKFKYTTERLTDAQLKELIQIPGAK
jgi:NitT/TauT family transport system substrate-binding protein